MENIILVISAPSGTGKTTIGEKFLKLSPSFKRCITCTTRPPRAGERDGRDYYFLTKEKFLKMIDRKMFIEYIRLYDHYYGTLKSEVEKNLKAGNDILLVIDGRGGMSIKKIFPESILVFLLPPSFNELERRIKFRGLDTDEIIGKRLAMYKSELEYLKRYDYVVVNKKIDESVDIIRSIVTAERHRIRKGGER